MHGDEANQAVKAGILWEEGEYAYDAQEHHGPSLYWLTLPSLWLSGAENFAQTTEWSYRIVPVVFGAAVVAVVLLLADGLGWPAAALAALWTAVSPAMVYYSRYYVQEMLLVFFTASAIACGWRFVRSLKGEGDRSPRLGRSSLFWAAAAGAAVGMMHATKETWILAAFAMVAACAASVLWGKGFDRRAVCPPPQDAAKSQTSGQSGKQSAASTLLVWPLWAGGLVALVAAVGIAAALYSSFGTHPRGPLDSVLAYGTYFRRGSAGGIHAHPWWFYLELLLAFRPARGFFWTEGLIAALALVGALAALAPRGLPDSQRPLVRFLAFYALGLTAIYALVRYKTPWCMLSFFHAWILLAGVGGWFLLTRTPTRVGRAIVALALSAGLLHLGWECRALNGRLQADGRNPYVYAHSSNDVLNLARQMERLAEAAPQGHRMVIHVLEPENYWPIPWYLRQFDRDRVGYWQDAATWQRDTAGYPPPEVILVASDIQEGVDSHLKGTYNQQMLFGLRPGVFVCGYVRADVWEAFLKAAE